MMYITNQSVTSPFYRMYPNTLISETLTNSTSAATIMTFSEEWNFIDSRHFKSEKLVRLLDSPLDPKTSLEINVFHFYLLLKEKGERKFLLPAFQRLVFQCDEKIFDLLYQGMKEKTTMAFWECLGRALQRKVVLTLDDEKTLSVFQDVKASLSFEFIADQPIVFEFLELFPDQSKI